MTPRCLRLFSAGLVLFLGVSFLSCLSADAQDMNAYSNRRGADMPGRNSLPGGVPSFQDTIEFLTEKAAEDERERATRESRFRVLPNYGSRQLDDYFKRLSPSLKYRQYGQ